MAFDRKFDDRQRGDFPQRKFQGNWECSDCGAKITELPFEPSGDRPVRCADCHSKWRNSQRFGR